MHINNHAYTYVHTLTYCTLRGRIKARLVLYLSLNVKCTVLDIKCIVYEIQHVWIANTVQLFNYIVCSTVI